MPTHVTRQISNRNAPAWRASIFGAEHGSLAPAQKSTGRQDEQFRMEASEPAHKKQRRIQPGSAGRDGGGGGGGVGAGDVGGVQGSPSEVALSSPAVGSQIAADDATAPSAFVSDAHGGPADDTSNAHGDDLRDANEYAHLLLAQAAETSARMLESNVASHQHHDPTASSSSAPGTSVHAHETEYLIPQAGPSTDANAAGTSTHLAHPRLQELDLMLLRISHGSEPIRYGLVCQQCRTAVKLTQLAAHLTRKDAHLNFKAKTKRALISKTLTAELLEIINSLVQEAGADPKTAIGGLGASCLLSFEDFFGPSANPTEPRPPLPSLQIKPASKCQRCLRLVSSTHKKAHRSEEHPNMDKAQVPFVIVRAQELARNGAVLFQVFEEEISPPAPSNGFGAEISAEQALMDQDHREALSNVLSAITAATPLRDGGTSTSGEHQNFNHSNSFIESPAPPQPAPDDDELYQTSDRAGKNVAERIAEDLANLPDAPDPSILSRATAAAAAAAAAALVAEQHASRSP
ncbi:unnamed protein product [Tilletia laevis]|uniref:C2H2-type domain-containing protein n=3 Tax=Tilletia TaxID=13289 RepID=A0ABN7IRP8_9BASI|nr:hypothetical protein CF335_g522 [Tilletia laevis]CAD6891446.1 unnamed protein product [Tilletia caries]CAD6915441.1 unnamed protein product [Tilletia caries]CAD6930565.1 unnamed protein product [Tilletia caries]CAD6941489.1 unnamed protein product [Tilletia laevis]